MTGATSTQFHMQSEPLRTAYLGFMGVSLQQANASTTVRSLGQT